MRDPALDRKQSLLILSLVLFTTPLLGSATDIFVPSLPYITEYFNAGSEITRMSVTTYLVFYGILQLLAGGIVDSFGRRNVILFSLFSCTIVSLAIPYSNSIYTLLGLRALQGVFSAGIGVSLRSITSDTFSGIQLKKYMSYVAVSWGIGPVFSPYLGGYLQHLFDWKANFYFLATYYFTALLAMIFWLPETIKERHRFHFKVIRANYSTLFKSPIFIGGGLICGLTYGIITVYNVLGPFLIQSTLGYSPVVYGRVALFLGVGWFTGNFIVRFIVARFSLQNITRFTCGIFSFVALLLFLFAVTGVFNLWTTAIPPILLFICGGVLFAIYLGHSLSLFRHIGGTASALLGSIFSIFAGLMSLIGSWLSADTLVPLALTYLGLIIVAYLSYRFLIKNQPQ